MEEEFDFNELPPNFRQQAKFAIDFGHMLDDINVDWSNEFNFQEMEDWYDDEDFF